MKLRIIALASLLSTQVWANTLPNGTFNGEGLWKNATTQGTYKTSTVIDGTSVSSQYTMKDGSQKTWKFDVAQKGDNFFDVKVNDTVIGDGYCLDKAQVCHYSINVGKLQLEETITAMDGKLYRFGSKDDGSGKTMWQESLK